MSGLYESDPIDQDLVTALVHPLRVQILEILNEQEASPKILADLTKASLGVAAYHVNVLRECGCIKLVKTEPGRGALQHFYRAEPRSYIGHQDWRKVPHSVRNTVTATALKTFFKRVAAAMKAGTLDGQDDTTLNWFTIAVDKVGRAQVFEIMKATCAQLQHVHEQSRERVAMSGEALTPVVIGLAAFEAARRAKGK